MPPEDYGKSLFLVLFLSLASTYGDTNVLVNPGLENGTDGWLDRSCRIAAVASPVHSGSGSAKAFGRSETWQGIRQPLMGKMVEGKTYRISGWVRLENAPSGTVTLSFDQRDDGGTKYPNVARVTATDSDWTELSGNFTLDVNGTLAALDIYFEGPPPGVNFFIDDVNVYGPRAATVETVAPKPVEPNATAKIDADIRYQKIEGFGAAGAYYTMELVNHNKKTELYNVLFKELGLDIFRIRNNYDMEPNSFRETAEIVKGAKALLGENLKIMMSSWSPPAYLKSQANTIGGTLKKNNGKYIYDEFAKWWYDSLTAYAKASVKADYINIQNEPDYLARWDSCRLDPTENSDYAGYDAAFEAVWNKLNTEMGQDMPKMLAPEAYGIISAKRYIDSLDDLSHVYGYSHHLYDCAANTAGCGSEPDLYLPEMKNFKSKLGDDKPLFQTEYQHREPDAWTQAMNTALLMHNSLTVEGVAGYLYWDLFWGPWNISMVSLNNPDSYTINPPYYAFKQYSAFIDSGWQRLDASTENSGLRISAYISPDNKKLTVVLINISESINITGNFSFKGFTVSKGEVFRSSRSEKCVSTGSFDKNKPLLLPASSITTLVLCGN